MEFVSGIDQDEDLEALRSRFQSAAQNIFAQISGQQFMKLSASNPAPRSPSAAYRSPSTMEPAPHQRFEVSKPGRPSMYASEREEDDDLFRRFQSARQGLWRQESPNAVPPVRFRSPSTPTQIPAEPQALTCVSEPPQPRDDSAAAALVQLREEDWIAYGNALADSNRRLAHGSGMHGEEVRRARSRSGSPVIVPDGHRAPEQTRPSRIFANKASSPDPVPLHGGHDYLASTQCSRTRTRHTARRHAAQRAKEKLLAEERDEKLVVRRRATASTGPLGSGAHKAPKPNKATKARAGKTALQRSKAPTRAGFSLKELADMEVTTSSNAGALHTSELSDHRMSVLRNTAGKQGAMVASAPLSAAKSRQSRGSRVGTAAPRGAEGSPGVHQASGGTRDQFVQSALRVAERYMDADGNVRLQQLQSVMPADEGFLRWLLQGRRDQEQMSIAQLRVAATVYQEQLRASSDANLISEAERWQLFSGVDKFTPSVSPPHTPPRGLAESGPRGLDRTDLVFGGSGAVCSPEILSQEFDGLLEELKGLLH